MSSFSYVNQQIFRFNFSYLLFILLNISMLVNKEKTVTNYFKRKRPIKARIFRAKVGVYYNE